MGIFVDTILPQGRLGVMMKAEQGSAPSTLRDIIKEQNRLRYEARLRQKTEGPVPAPRNRRQEENVFDKHSLVHLVV